MSITSINPYIGFNGNAEQAIALYRKALGAEVEAMMRWAEGPEGCVPDDYKNRVMHSQLRIGGGLVMVCDSMPDQPGVVGGNVEVVLQFDDAADMQRKFDALAEGGKVTLPIHDAFWGDKFGMLTDAFGVRWMFVGGKA